MSFMTIRSHGIAQPCGELELTLTLPVPMVKELPLAAVEEALRHMRLDLMTALVELQRG